MSRIVSKKVVGTAGGGIFGYRLRRAIAACEAHSKVGVLQAENDLGIGKPEGRMRRMCKIADLLSGLTRIWLENQGDNRGTRKGGKQGNLDE